MQDNAIVRHLRPGFSTVKALTLEALEYVDRLYRYLKAARSFEQELSDNSDHQKWDGSVALVPYR